MINEQKMERERDREQKWRKEKEGSTEKVIAYLYECDTRRSKGENRRELVFILGVGLLKIRRRPAWVFFKELSTSFVFKCF